MLPGSSDPFAADTGLRRLDDDEATRELGEYRRRCLPSSRMPLRVGHLVPGGYAAYCRILPPLHVTAEKNAATERRRWSTVLASEEQMRPGRLVESARLAEEALARVGGRLDAVYGFLDAATTTTLVARLRGDDGVDPECVYYFWSGRSVVGQRPGHSVYAGPLAAAATLVPPAHLGLETPTAMWPRDMSWCLAVHTDSPAA
jgi:hypothetical protein